MAHLLARVADGLLYPVDGATPIPLDDPAWYAWLEEHASFSFETPEGAVTVRKERGRPSGWYWKAYRRAAGKVRTAYLGRSMGLTQARLHAAVATLVPSAATPLETRAPPAPAALPPPPAPPDADALLPIKLFMPAPRPHRVARPRLLDRLRAAFLPPLILIAAPAGYGKTTLVADWITGDHRAAAWLNLDAGDNDPGVFWRTVATALSALHPNAGARVLQLLRGSQPPSLDTVLSTLLNDLATHLPPDSAGRPALLILDDYHTITQRAIHETVLTLIEHLPPHLRVVLTSRVDPPLRLGRLRVRGQILELRAGDLAFDGAETRVFLLDTMGITLPEDTAATLATRTEGWPAALQLAALSLRTHPAPQAFLAEFGGSHRLLLTYLLDEVISGQPPAWQEFLLATSVLDQMCADLCAALLGPPTEEAGDGVAAAQVLLEELEAANLFIIPLDTTGHWYRYHQLFGETLRHRLRQQAPSAERTYRRRASAWYARAGYEREAVAQALAAQDWPAAAEWIARFAEDVRRRGELSTLAGWLKALPASLVHSDPRLGLLQILLFLFENQYTLAESALTEVERGLAFADVAGAPDGSADPAALASLRGRVAIVRSQIERVLRSDLVQSQAEAQTALALLPPGDLEWRGMALMNLASIAYFADALAQGTQYYSEAATLSIEGGLHLYMCIVRSRAVALLYDWGRLVEAQALCADTRRLLAAMADDDLPGTCQVDWTEALLCYETGDLTEAERLLKRAIALADQGRQLEIQGFAHLIMSRVFLARGDTDSATRELEAAADSLAPARTGAAVFHPMLSAWQATVQLVAGDLPPGARWIEVLDESASVAHWVLRPLHLLPARVRLAVGDHAGALTYLERCCAQAEAREARTLLMSARALQALVLTELGRRPAARATLLQALTLAASEGYVRAILDAGPGIGALLQALVEELTRAPDTNPAFLAYVARLSAAAAPDAPAAASGAPLVSGVPAVIPDVLLTSRELAILRLAAAGRSNQEIATQLILAVSTVKWYLREIYQKLGSGNRVEAVARARALGLIR